MPRAHDESGPSSAVGAELYLIVGLPGAGKTTRARGLAHKHAALRLTPDEWMIPLYGHPDPDGKRDVLEGRLIWTAVEALRLNVNTVLDFGFWSRAERAALHWLARSVGATARTVYLPVDPHDQLERVSARWRAAPGETWEITAKDLADWRAMFEAPDERELAGAVVMSPPGPYADWGRWIDDRWPSARGTAG